MQMTTTALFVFFIQDNKSINQDNNADAYN